MIRRNCLRLLILLKVFIVYSGVTNAQSENIILTPEYIPITDCSLRQKHLSQPMDSLQWWTDTVCSQVDLELLHIEMNNRFAQAKIDSTLSAHFENYLFSNLDCTDDPDLEKIRDSLFTYGRFIYDQEYISFIQLWLPRYFIQMTLGMYEMNRSEKILTISVAYDSFSGGAHPNREGSVLNFDVSNGKTLSLTDCFDPASLPLLTSLAYTQFIQMDPDSIWGLNEYGFFLSNDFFFDEIGVHFWYEPYEIGPYVLGEPEIILPVEMIQPLIAPNSIINEIYK